MRKFTAFFGVLTLVGLSLTTSAADAAVPTCFGQPATIVGTPGDDDIHGEAGVADVIWAGGGDDLVEGGDFYGDGDIPGTATDLLCGGPGDDALRGAPGEDWLSGGQGDDRVDGGNGADVELGNSGDDSVGSGSFSEADRVDDVMRGGSGNDLLVGGWGRDRMYGNAGADELWDLECDGPTYLDGGPGSDYLESWSSSFDGWHGNVCAETGDHVVGGSGKDTAAHDSLDIVHGVEHDTVVTEPTG